MKTWRVARILITAALAVVWDNHVAMAGEPAMGLSFSTYFGEAGREDPRGAAVDSRGNIIVSATAYSGSRFSKALTHGPLGGKTDILVLKFSPDGSEVLWMAMIGGSETDYPIGVELDADDNIYTAGLTGSADFPTTEGAYDRSHNGGSDAFALKISPDGKSLIFSSFLGGSSNDSARGGLAVDDKGAAYVAGVTSSRDFLAGSGSRVNDYIGGKGDAFIAKVSPDGSEIMYSRLLGGSKDTLGDVVVGAQVDVHGNVYAACIVWSVDAVTTEGAFDRTFNGGQSDLYVAKVSPDGKRLIYATYFGGSGNEYHEHRMALDSRGNVYLVGNTDSIDFPAINAHQARIGGDYDAYLVKLDEKGHPVFSTYIGGSRGEGPVGGPALDHEGNVFVAGATRSFDFEVTKSVYQTELRDHGGDVFLQTYSPSGELLYSTYYGGTKKDEAHYVTTDTSGNPVIVGKTGSSNFPVSAGAFDRIHEGGMDGFAVKFYRIK